MPRLVRPIWRLASGALEHALPMDALLEIPQRMHEHARANAEAPKAGSGSGSGSELTFGDALVEAVLMQVLQTGCENLIDKCRRVGLAVSIGVFSLMSSAAMLIWKS